MNVVFYTDSGSIYEVQSGMIRRYNPEHVKEGDSEWHTLMTPLELRVGQSAHIVTNSLSGYGEDEEGPILGTKYTTRTTSPVVAVTEK